MQFRYVGVLLVGLWAAIGIPGAAADAAESFVLRAKHLIPASAEGPLVLHDAVVVVRDGKIVAVGQEGDPGLSIPSDLTVLEVRDGYVMPGLVAIDSAWAGRHRGNEAVGAGYRAIDNFDPYGDYRDTLRAGVTTVHLSPGDHRLVTGRGAVVKLAEGGDPEVLEADADLAVNLGVYGSPSAVEFTFPASSDVALVPPTRQRPASRLGQFLGLREAVEQALASGGESTAGSVPGRFSYHQAELAEVWRAGLPLRIRADRAADLLGAFTFLDAMERTGYLVGGAEAHRITDSLRRSGTGLAYQPRYRFSGDGGDVGVGDGALDLDERAIASLTGVKLALCPPAGQRVERLRLTAAAAHRAGLDEAQAIRAITSVPAELLGIADRVGSIAPGRDADFVVFSGHPLHVSSHVQRVIVNGRSSMEAPSADAVVVRAGTLWVSPDRQISNGEMLVEDGKIVAVGSSVPHPPGARVIDAGPDGFVAPGFIDARGHLGLAGDRSRAPLSADLTLALGAPDERDNRVAAAGVTSVLQTPYSFDGSGSRFAAIKTQGVGRDERVVRSVAGIGFSLVGSDPSAVASSLERQLSRGRRYVQSWEKYEKALAEFLEKEKRGESTVKEVEEEVVEEAKDDPITGVWEGTVRGGPLPEPVSGKLALRLTGKAVEGRVTEPAIPIEHRIVAEFSGDTLKGEIEVDTDGMGFPQLEAKLTGEDQMSGTVALMGISVEFEARRIEKRAVEFKVEKRRRVQKGRPKPPAMNSALEPYRDLFAKKIPLVIEARRPALIKSVVEAVTKRFKLPLVILDGSQSYYHDELLAESKVGVVIPATVVTRSRGKTVNLADRLNRSQVQIAFQSHAEDGARHLEHRALFAVEQGLGADAALAALTTHPAKMFMLDAHIGSLEAGRHGDFIICRGHPFRAGGRIERVFVNGQEVRR